MTRRYKALDALSKKKINDNFLAKAINRPDRKMYSSAGFSNDPHKVSSLNKNKNSNNTNHPSSMYK